VPFLSPAGSPCQRPPFSRLNAVDVTTGAVVWSRPLGTAKSIGPYGTQSHLPITIGTPTFGGAISTASGLTFVAASLDHTIRAFETATGKLLWEGDLPADGLATPMTYSTSDGRQFLVIGVGDAPGGMRAAAGEGKAPPKAAGTIVAFALPSP
jgi:glucose dehydrogenase